MITRRNTLLAALSALLVSLIAPLPLLASGGNTPVPGIDIIVKEAGITASFAPRDLKAVNALKGMEKPALIGKIAAGYVTKITKGEAPKGGWAPVLSKGLIKDWCLDCKGGTTKINAKTSEGKSITIYLKLDSIKGETD